MVRLFPVLTRGGKKRVNGGKRRQGFLRLDMKSHMYDHFNLIKFSEKFYFYGEKWAVHTLLLIRI